MLMISVFIIWRLDGEHWEDSLTPFVLELEKVYTFKWHVYDQIRSIFLKA